MKALQRWLSAQGAGRRALFLIALSPFALLALLALLNSSVGAQTSNPIVLENQQPGTANWQIPTDGALLADDTANQVKGYASASSANVGSNLAFYVTVNPAQTFTMDIYRMGWYGGLGGRLLQHVGPLSGVQQPACPLVDTSTNLIACNWAPSYTLGVPTSWTDGIYLAVLTNTSQYQNYVVFVVRNDTRTAPLLYQQSVNTYQAYNNWGGKSLYSYNSTAGVQAYKVSFDRPYSDDGSGDYFGWEVYMVQWLEQKGYDVTYSTDIDTHTNGSRLRSVKGFLASGHDEYWSKEMYDAAQGARDTGTSIAFFGANDVYWQVRYEASGGGAPNRVLVCYKTSEPPFPTDPITATNPTLTTTTWRSAPVNRPEQSLIGVQFTSQVGNNWDVTVNYNVTNSTNWVYAGTGFTDTTSVAKLVGYEADRQWSTVPLPGNQSYTLLSLSPYTNVGGASDSSNASIYKPLSGSWVFAAGTMSWSWALERPGYVNAGIAQATKNILDKFLTNVAVRGTATPTPPPITPTPPANPSRYRNAVLGDAPAAYLRLNEVSGTTAADQTGQHPGTYQNSPALGQQGALAGDPDTAAGFNSSSTGQYVDVPYSVDLNRSPFSVEAWAYPTGGAGTYRGIVASRHYPQGWVLYAGGSNDYEFWVNSGAGMIAVAGGTATLNTWVHLAGTFDGSTAKLYINGALAGSGAVTSTYTPQAVSSLAIAQSEPGTSLWFPGAVDEPAVYNTALSPTQVQNHFLAATAATLTSPSPGTTLSGASVPFSWTTAAGADTYALWVGSTVGGYDSYYTYCLCTSTTVSGLPTNGSAVYVRLWTHFASGWVFSDYAYTAATFAVLTSPAAGSTLTATSVPFSWTSAAGADTYSLWVGSTVGGYDLYYTYCLCTSTTATGLPTDGSSVYVRLWTHFAETGWSFTDYAYTAFH